MLMISLLSSTETLASSTAIPGAPAGKTAGAFPGEIGVAGAGEAPDGAPAAAAAWDEVGARASEYTRAVPGVPVEAMCRVMKIAPRWPLAMMERSSNDGL